MATIGRANNASYMNTARTSYISTAPFQNNIFLYTTSIVNNTNTGTLTAWSVSAAANPPGNGSTATTCPAGRVLRETGRKLYPGAYPGINTYMVSVYDAQTQLTGFIDPNSSVYSLYNNDKPNFIADGVDAATGVGTDAGMSIFTLGNITATGFISTASYLTTAGTLTAGTGIVTTTGQIRSATATTITPNGTVSLNAALGQVFTYAVSNTVATETVNATNYTSTGEIVYFVVTPNTSSCTITFGTGFKKTGTLVTGTAGTGGRFVVAFVSDGSFLCELSRTAVQA
jgi:hypothetical protein